MVRRTWCLRGERHDKENMLDLGQVGQKNGIGGGGI